MKVFLIVVGLLAGCATSTFIPAGPSGRPMHFIKCGSAVLDACYAKAAEVCPKGYDFVDRTESGNAAFVRTQPNVGFLVRGPHNFAVECK